MAEPPHNPPLNYEASITTTHPQVSSSLPPEVVTCLKNARFVCISTPLILNSFADSGDIAPSRNDNKPNSHITCSPPCFPYELHLPPGRLVSPDLSPATPPYHNNDNEPSISQDPKPPSQPPCQPPRPRLGIAPPTYDRRTRSRKKWIPTRSRHKKLAGESLAEHEHERIE